MMCQCEYISHVSTGGCKKEAAIRVDTVYGIYNVCEECATNGHINPNYVRKEAQSYDA